MLFVLSRQSKNRWKKNFDNKKDKGGALVRICNKKGQSTLEYLILVAGVIAVLIVFLNPRSGKLSGTINTTYEEVTDGMETMADKLTTSWE